MRMPLITLIIPMHNAEKFIKQCIDSIKKQTYQNIEIIMVNDGSKDRTLEFCYKYILDDTRFKVYSQSNSGASAARNYGLERAGGKYVAFVDVDDYIFPEYINYLYDLIITYQADMTCCGYYKMWDSEQIPSFSYPELTDIEFDRVSALEDFFYRKHITGYPVLKLYKRSVLDEVTFPLNVKYGEDVIFTFYALHKCNKIVYGSKILYIYYQHTESTTHNIDFEQLQKSWKHHMEILQYVEREDKNILLAAYAKYFIMGIDFICRVWKDKKSNDFKNELLSFIKLADGIVLKDKKCKKSNRILAAISCFNPILSIQLCRFYIWLKIILKFETRRSV